MDLLQVTGHRIEMAVTVATADAPVSDRRWYRPIVSVWQPRNHGAVQGVAEYTAVVQTSEKR